MKALKPILILCLSILFVTSCKKEVDMTLMQKTVLENADIRQIAVSDAWEVTLVADNRSYVELEYSAYLEPGLTVRMEGSKLEIGFAGNVWPVINSVWRAIIHTPQLERIEADDASQVQCKGDFEGQTIEVELSDASNCSGLIFSGEACRIKMENASVLTGLHFAGNRCTAVLEHASQFNGQIEASEHLEIELEEASRFVNKSGITTTATVKAHDASRLNMVETQVGEMHVDLSGASEATVWVTTTIDGSLKDASTLFYKSNPQIQVNCSEGSELIPL